MCVELHVGKSPHDLEANVHRAQLFRTLGARISVACCCLAGRDTFLASFLQIENIVIVLTGGHLH